MLKFHICIKLFELELGDQAKVQGLKLSVLTFSLEASGGVGCIVCHNVRFRMRAAMQGLRCVVERGMTISKPDS